MAYPTSPRRGFTHLKPRSRRQQSFKHIKPLPSSKSATKIYWPNQSKLTKVMMLVGRRFVIGRYILLPPIDTLVSPSFSIFFPPIFILSLIWNHTDLITSPLLHARRPFYSLFLACKDNHFPLLFSSLSYRQPQPLIFIFLIFVKSSLPQ